MLKLHTRKMKKDGAEPIVLRVTSNNDLPLILRSQELYLVPKNSASIPEGFAAYVEVTDTPRLFEGKYRKEKWYTLPPDFDYLSSGDIVRINGKAGELRVLYRRSSPSNAIFATERCNSMCLMCSQPPKTTDDSYLIQEWLQAIPLMDRATPQLGITGGEPTLLGDGLLEIIRACKNFLPETHVQMLSNGRKFANLPFCESFVEVDHPSFLVAIPVYSDIAGKHEFVVQAPGSFDETIRGILNLARYGQRIEIRVVLHALTVERLPELATFIARNFPFVEHVALMGLEIMGFTKMNLDALWIDPIDYQQQLCEAVNTLAASRINVSIYNHQLCVLDRSLWPFAVKSISDWKNEYIDACDGCAARDLCGGFFSSGTNKYSRAIKPITEEVSLEQQPCNP